MGKKTPFYEMHLASQAKMVDFAGWDMPLHYGSQIKEHHQVRLDAGMFDVSHMGIVDVEGKDATLYLRYLLANNVDRLTDNKAFYTCMLNDNGGVIDDLIVYRLSPNFYRIVINAGTRDKDLAWMKQQAQTFLVNLTPRTDLAMLAIQGNKIIEKLPQIFNADEIEILKNLKPFNFTILNDCFIARTGYTGEDGFELIFPAKIADFWWQKMLAAQIPPCGLGARDTLRLEAGLNLYGADMDENVSPLESNLGWTVSFDPPDRLFIGREKLQEQKNNGIKARLVGLVLNGPGIIRNHLKVKLSDESEGEVTSGGYSPTLEKSIALARVPATIGAQCFVLIRDKPVEAFVVKPPFVRHGKKMF